MRKLRWTGIGIAIALATIAIVYAVPRGGRAQVTLPEGVRIDRLVADKSEHRLDAFAGGRRVARYRIAIGSGGMGPKTYEGDNRTPEGVYRIDSRHRSRRFHRFLHVSYPNDADRRRYAEARARGDVPEGAGIGGAIGIHGESDVPLVRELGTSLDWTAGCIAVTDDEIEQLYRAVVPDAVIEIRE